MDGIMVAKEIRIEVKCIAPVSFHQSEFQSHHGIEHLVISRCFA